MIRVPLGDVARIDRRMASAADCASLPFVGLEHIEKDHGRFIDAYRHAAETLEAAKFRFGPEHVLYGKLRPYLNKVAKPEFHGVCTTEILPLLPNSDRLLRTFLYAVLLSRPFVAWASQSVSGANLPRLDPDRLLEFEIPLPPLERQQHFGEALERVNRLRRMRRYSLELSDTFLPAAFLEMFGNEYFPAVTVEQLVADSDNAIRTGPFGSQLLHSEFTDRGIAVLGIDNVVGNRFTWAERRFVTKEKYAQLRRYTVFPGDVLISIMGTCGRCAIVPHDIPTAINTKHLCCITLDQRRCLPIFLQAAFLHHPQIQRELGVAQKGAIMDGLNMQIIKGLRVPVPPMPMQAKYAALVARAERASAVLVESLRHAEHLFQSLLHQAFTDGLAA